MAVFPDSFRAKRLINGEKRTKTPKKRTFGPENELAIFEKKKKVVNYPTNRASIGPDSEPPKF